MNGPQKHYAELKKKKKKARQKRPHIIEFHLHEISTKGNLWSLEVH